MLWIGLMIPFRVGFNLEDTQLANVLTDFYFDFVFGFDIFMTFHTPIRKKNGELNYDKKKIRRKYLLGWFAADLYCMIPLSVFKYSSGEGSLDE
jgi:hypothetical protein